MNGDFELVKLLIENEARANVKNGFDKNCDSALVKATVRGQLDVAKLLMNYDADFQLKNKTNDTALRFASLYRRFKILKLLVENGADVKYKFGKFALMHASNQL